MITRELGQWKSAWTDAERAFEGSALVAMGEWSPWIA